MPLSLVGTRLHYSAAVQIILSPLVGGGEHLIRHGEDEQLAGNLLGGDPTARTDDAAICEKHEYRKNAAECPRARSTGGTAQTGLNLA